MAPAVAQAPGDENLSFDELRSFIAKEYGVAPETVTLDTEFKSLGGDTLNLVFVMGEIEDKHALMLPGHEVNGITTVRDLYYAYNTKAARLAQGPAKPGVEVEPSADLLGDMKRLYFVGAYDRAAEELAACEKASPGRCLKLLEARSNASLEVMRASGGEAQQAEDSARALLVAVNQGTDDYRTYGVTALHNLGVALTERGRLKEGEEHLREALRLLLDPNTKDFWQPFAKGRMATPYVQLRRVALDLARNLGLQGRYDSAMLAFATANNEAIHQGYGAYNRDGGAVIDGGVPRTRSIHRDAVDDYTEFGTVLALLEGIKDNRQDTVGADIDGDAGFYFEQAYEWAQGMPAEAGDYRAILDAEYGVYLTRIGEPAKALEFLDAALTNLPSGPSRKGRASLAYGRSLAALGRGDESLRYLQLASSQLARALPIENADRIVAHWELGKLQLKQGAGELAVVELEQAVRGAAASSFQGADPAEEARLLRRYSALFALAVEANARRGPGSADAARAFTDAQLASASETAAALAQVAAAMADGTGEMAVLEGRRRQLLGERQGADRELFRFASTAGAASSETESRLATRYRTLSRQMGEVEAEMARRDPAYFDLVRPRPLDLTDVQQLLRPDEALLFLIVGEAGTTTFAVTREKSGSAFSVDLTEAKLTATVQALRSQLQADLDGASRGLERDTAYAGSGFDAATANALYRALIGPVEDVFAGKTSILVAATGPLGSLPLQILPLSIPADAAPVYFGEKYALATLPAVSSLRSLRCFRGSGARPAACGTTGSSEPVRSAAGPALAAIGAPTLRGAPGASRGAPSYNQAFNGEFADPEFLRNLPYLPGTLQEITRIEKEFAGENVLVKTGDEAREAFVRTDPGVASARYLLLSTHGLLQSETGFVGEPGLVFTPPGSGQATAADDGLLTASEAAQMRLAADLLVLSACNTASSDGKLGAEGLSGLAKAFLYAGAGALLVSHWPVDDRAGAEIVGEFLRLSKDSRLDRASALRQAAQHVRAQGKWSSPAFWAPFVLVGLPD